MNIFIGEKKQQLQCAFLCHHFLSSNSLFPTVQQFWGVCCPPQSHLSSLLGILDLQQSSPIQPLQAGGALSVSWSPSFFKHSLSILNAAAKWGLRALGGAGVGQTSVPQGSAVHRGKAAESSVLLHIALELPPQRQGDLTGWSTDSSYNNLVVSRPSKSQYSQLVFSLVILPQKCNLKVTKETTSILCC